MRGAKENPELAEVRAILLKVQRLGAEPEEISAAADPAPGASSPNQAQATPPRTTGIAIFDRKHRAIQKSEPEAPVKSRLAIYLGAAGAIAAALAIVFATAVTSPPAGTPALSQQDEDALLTDARRLLSEGDVASARTRLLRGGADAHADVAFALAQAFDPNYLQSLPNANSAPDPSEAARWYKKWYELAVQSGLEMDAGRLQRIIKAMPKH